ncbi:MAG: SHOCT domain-containing protein, partial [Desulfobacterota bacterium]|nr:SHOCT domain-containing protein [Thermodesulfobacteriota bacterium]
ERSRQIMKMNAGRKWWLIGFLVSLDLGLIPRSVLADYRQYYGWGPGMMGWWGPMAWFGPVGMILFWVLLVLLIILLIRGLRSGKVIGRERGEPTESALEILKKRYARGEINKEEYLEKKRDLEGV